MALACASRELADLSVFYVYLIKSTVEKWIYVGFCENLEIRLNQHNSGQVRSTKSYKPFRLLFVQIVKSRNEARNLEKFLKVRFNKEALLNLL